jgi:hypothetical protein
MYAANCIFLCIQEFLTLFKLWKDLASDSDVSLRDNQVFSSELYSLLEGLTVSNIQVLTRRTKRGMVQQTITNAPFPPV